MIFSFAARYDHALDIRFLDFELLEGRDNAFDERDLDLLDDKLYAVRLFQKAAVCDMILTTHCSAIPHLTLNNFIDAPPSPG